MAGGITRFIVIRYIMNSLLRPLKTESLKEVFIKRFEELIISGHFPIGSRLPSERELSNLLGVSRPVVHEGLVDLSSKGLVTMIPRVGTLVNDYRSQGSLTILNSLLSYHEGSLEPNILESMLRMRMLFEIETARLAARNRTENHLDEFRTILEQERNCDQSDPELTADLDFRFHHTIAIASGNVIYPLLINSFRQVYTNITGKFFTDTTLAGAVFSYHDKLVHAISEMDEDVAVAIMTTLLEHGEKYLKAIISQEHGGHHEHSNS